MGAFSLFNKKKKNSMKETVSNIDNDYFIREDFEGKKFSNLDEIEVENLVAYIMRNRFHHK